MAFQAFLADATTISVVHFRTTAVADTATAAAVVIVT